MKVLYRQFIYPVLVLFISSVVLSCSYRYIGRQSVKIIRSGTITNRNIGEASGIAASRINEDIVWVINDSGNSASVFALNAKGEHLGTIRVADVANNDWEDLASFEYNGKPYILIADVGDNFASRPEYIIHFIEEPDISKISVPSPLDIKPSRSISFTYEDGPRDCESVAVDIFNRKVLLLTKRDRPPILYELPLEADKRAVASRCVEIKPLPIRTSGISEFSNYSNQPTAMDISADGLSAVVLTYGSAFYFSRKKSEEWTTVLSGAMKEITFPQLRQAESVCFSRDGSSIFITSEQLPAPLLKIVFRK